MEVKNTIPAEQLILFYKSLDISNVYGLNYPDQYFSCVNANYLTLPNSLE